MRQIKDGLLDLLFPPRCIGCGRVGSWLCATCLEEIELIRPPICPRCGRPLAEITGVRHEGRLCYLCQHAPLQIDGIRSVAYFEGTLREAIHRFKYANLRDLAFPLGEMMSTYWRESPLPAEVIVPVPLHENRLRARGYNQAALLAQVLGQKIGLPISEGTLARVRETLPQVGLGAQERKENVRDAFRCLDDGLAGRRVLLVDDVCTTGSTLEACSLALRQGRARSIWALTLARPR